MRMLWPFCVLSAYVTWNDACTEHTQKEPMHSLSVLIRLPIFSTVPFVYPHQMHKDLMRRLSIRVRNSCVHWASTYRNVLLRALNICIMNSCVHWAYASRTHVCTEQTHQEVCTLLSYSAPFLAMQHPTKLRYVLLRYAAPYAISYWATLHPDELRCTMLSYPPPPVHNAPHCARLHTYELCSTFLKMLHLSKPQGTQISHSAPHALSYAAPTELGCTLLSYGAPCWAKLHTLWASSP